jgi:hypothetical protein
MKILVAALLLMPAAALASSPFDGTWKMSTESLKTTGKPDMFSIADGMYSCTSCVPEVKVKADGTDQKVTGHSYYDSLAVHVLSPTSVRFVNKLGGKETSTTTYELSADGKTLNGKFTDNSGVKTATGSFTEARVLAGPAGSHAVSGTWQPGALTGANEEARTVNYEMTPEHFGMHWNGQTYQAKFDGKEYPVENDPGHTMVTLKRIDANTVLETDHRLGKITDEIRLAAAKDGKTIEVTDKDVQHGQTTTYTLEKQP